MKIVIQQGVPIPKKEKRTKPVRIYGLTKILKKMKKGDSFLYPSSKRAVIEVVSRRHNIKITIVKMSEDKVRVWRI